MLFSSVAFGAAERMTCSGLNLTLHFPDIQTFLKPYEERGDVLSTFEFEGQTYEVMVKEGYFLDLSLWNMESRFLVVPKLFRKEKGPITKIDLEIMLFDTNMWKGHGTVKFRYQKKSVIRHLFCEIE